MLSAYVAAPPSSALPVGALLLLPGSSLLLAALAAVVVIGSGVLVQKVLVAHSVRRFSPRVLPGGSLTASRRAA